MTVTAAERACSPQDSEHRVLSRAGVASETAPKRTTTKAAGVPDSKARSSERSGWSLPPRLSRGRDTWDGDAVAAHLMGCQAQMVRGLARKTPWVGLDDETLGSCFGHAAAVVARIAVSGQRPEWRTTKDLEKAQIAAFRHQALDHWKRTNAQSRRGDRFTVAFDPDRHAAEHTPIDRLFEQPDLHTIERDLLAELADDRLRAFWRVVLLEQRSFKDAGDRLGLSKSAVMASTRGGRAVFAAYLERRANGELCRDRSLDIAAHRAGNATSWRTERAEAHLESCYACALVHEPRTSAIQRGILGLAPTGFILRLLSRTGDAASAPVMRIAESGSGSRAVAAGLAALTVAGIGVGSSITPPRHPISKSPDPTIRKGAEETVARPYSPDPVAQRPGFARGNRTGGRRGTSRGDRKRRPETAVKTNRIVREGNETQRPRQHTQAEVREFIFEVDKHAPPSLTPARKTPATSGKPTLPESEFPTP